jgi:uncharacterized protein
MNIDPSLEAARRVLLAQLPRAMAFYVYGSAARGDMHGGSDVDIAILLPHGDSLPDKLALMADLALVFGRDVDLVDLRKAGDFLRSEVLREGRAFYVADPDELLVWESSAMVSYMEHLYRIRGILDDFKRSGVGYAP